MSWGSLDRYFGLDSAASTNGGYKREGMAHVDLDIDFALEVSEVGSTFIPDSAIHKAPFLSVKKVRKCFCDSEYRMALDADC